MAADLREAFFELRQIGHSVFIAFRMDEKKFDMIHHFLNFRCMGRTNINLDDELVSKGLKATGLRTKRELVDLALRELVRRKEQKKILRLKGRVSWDGDLDQLRSHRF